MRRPRVFRPCRCPDDRGVTAVEFLGWVPLLIIVALAAIQLGVAGYAALQAGSGARAAARAAAQEHLEGDFAAIGQAAMSEWMADGAAVVRTADCGPEGGEVTVEARVTVPSVMPFVQDFGQAVKSVTMPCD